MFDSSQYRLNAIRRSYVLSWTGNVDLEKTFKWLEENPEYFKKQPFARFPLKIAKENFANNDNATINISCLDSGIHVQIYNLPTKGDVTLCCPCVENIDGCNTEDLTRAELLIAGMVGLWVDI